MRYRRTRSGKQVRVGINWAETVNQLATEGGKVQVQVSVSNEDLAKIAGVGVGLILFNAFVTSQNKK